MFDAVPYSSASILANCETWLLGGMISEIIDVPLLRAVSTNSGPLQITPARSQAL